MAKIDFIITCLGLSLIIILALMIGNLGKSEGFFYSSTPTPWPKSFLDAQRKVIIAFSNYVPLTEDMLKNPPDFFRDYFSYAKYFVTPVTRVSTSYNGISMNFKDTGLTDPSYLDNTNEKFIEYKTAVDTFYENVISRKYNDDEDAKQTLLTALDEFKTELNSYQKPTTSEEQTEEQTEEPPTPAPTTPKPVLLTTLPLSDLQKTWENIGCKRKLTEGDVNWWRTKDINSIKTDMTTYFNLTSTCSGTKEQHDLCSQDSCNPPAITGYTSLANRDQDGQSIKTYTIAKAATCISDCTKDKKCKGMVMSKANCWTIKSFPTPNNPPKKPNSYPQIDSVIYKKN